MVTSPPFKSCASASFATSANETSIFSSSVRRVSGSATVEGREQRGSSRATGWHRVLTAVESDGVVPPSAPGGASPYGTVSWISLSVRSARSRSRQVAISSSNRGAWMGIPGITSRIGRASSLKSQTNSRPVACLVWLRPSGEHPKRVPLPARQDHLSVRKGRAGFSGLGARDQERRAVWPGGLFLGDELNGLSALRELRAEQRGSQGVKGQPFGTVDHVGW